MKANLLLSLILCLCSIDTISQSLETNWLYIDGDARLYNVYLPESYEPVTPVPLIINIHGWVSTAGAFMRRTSDLRPYADTANFIAAYPSGRNFRWNSLEEDGGATALKYLLEMLDDIESRYNIDKKRIYITGHNDGGELAHLFACQYSDRIAAVASVKGSMSRETLKNGCQLSRPLPVLKIHNTNDFLTPFKGDQRRASVADQIDFFTESNNCKAFPEWIPLPDIDPSDSITVERYLYSDCEECADVELILELDSTSSLGYYYPVSTSEQPYYFDALEEIWRFFKRYTLEGGCQATSSQSYSSSSIQYFPNPAGKYLNILNNSNTALAYSIITLDGRIVLGGTLNLNETIVEVSSLAPGMYILKVSGSIMKFIKN